MTSALTLAREWPRELLPDPQRPSNRQAINFLDDRLPDRFWDKVVPEPNSGCWLWLAGVDEDGYASVWWPAGGGRQSKRGHRVAYTALVGSIPAGLQLDHLCRVRCCVNPAHLEAVTSAENTRRGESLTNIGARKEKCENGHPLKAVRADKRGCLICLYAARREWQANLVTAGLCKSGPSHGPAVRSGYCDRCAEKQNEWRRQLRARKRLATAPGFPSGGER